ncbi:uncharacterized protein M2352_003305 [Azospirillum fermentarium]|uniref:hypothetical protein n=1 Tax=Azospirillum fermentarium TaxID=1233114 RepID=UPI0022263BB0|nr:hypothetical protein [Azospirillum fermentarium]MCW2247671.1 uncharacterized protein [Azospirillum fermentarium]
MFTKILLVIVVIVAALFGMRFFRRISEAGKERLNRSAAQPAPSAGTGRSVPGGPRDAEDLEKCPECGAYVAPHSAVACGRPACPYGR